MLPELFCEKMKTLLGDEYEAFLAALDRPRAVGLRLNPLKLSLRDQCAHWSRQSVSPTVNCQLSILNLSPVPWCPTGFYYDETARPGLHPYHAAGAYYLQEPSAMAPAELLDPRPGERVLDLCAAPGGKSTQLAGKLAGEGLLVCNEIHPKRAAILASNLERLGVANALVLNEHPARLAERFPAFFDRILVDAPCSGEGMFRKHDAAFEDWSPETVAMCARRQAEILDSAALLLRPGGRLVYSTCTFSPEENEGSVAGFLARHPEFEVEKAETELFAPGHPEWADGNPDLANSLRLWPHKLNGEGHFAAVLRKHVGAAIGRPPEAEAFQSCHSEPCPERSRRGSEESVLSKLAGSRGGDGRRGSFDSAALRSGRRDRDALPEPVAALLQELGLTLPDGVPVLFGERVFWAPPETPALHGLKVLRPGLELAELRRGPAVPAHALALWAKRAASVHALSADDPACAAFLRGETLPTEASGWTLVTVDGLSLGWGKGVNGVLKNHYPKGLRINTLQG